MKVLVTGASGFICGYLIQELLDNGYQVVGLDNFSKYGRLQKSYDSHPCYKLVEGDAKDIALMKDLLSDCDHFVAAAAMIGGISYFHEFAYDLLAENERIIASSFDAAIWAHKERKLNKIVVLSSSMVFESTTEYPTPEGAERRSPPPRSTYGFQKLAVEYFVQGAYEQYKLPYTIVRPFNCVGIGEKRALSDRDIMSGNVRLAMSHVVPDLVQKLVKGQDPLHILGDGKQVRHYTYGGDLARGIRVCVEHPAALNQDFNLSTPVRTTVLELAELIWKKIHGSSKPFRYVSDPAYEYDVQERAPAVSKARDLLGFQATTPLSDILDEVIPWIAEQVEIGQMLNELVTAPVSKGDVMERPLTIVIPVYNEGANFPALWAEMTQHLDFPFTALVAYDFDGDDTLPVARQIIDQGETRLHLVKNTYGRGVVGAIRTGFDAAPPGPVLVVMADLSDDLGQVRKMLELYRAGSHIVVGSRYMKGGRLIGGPWFKQLLSRLSGLTLCWFRGIPTHDATNAFKIYDRAMLSSIRIESKGGFELSLEITVKAFLAGYTITETPSTWRDRTAGTSRFKLWKWLPHYLKWYFMAFQPKARRRAATEELRPT